MDFLPVLKYLKYFLFSRHRRGYGIHSPFVFNLVSVIFRNKIEADVVCSIEAIRRNMISNPGTIVVNDLGAGSKKMKSNLRKVSDIARYSAVSKKYGILLANLSKAFGGQFVLEFGTSLGISTMYMAATCPESKVCTMEGCAATSALASENFREAGLTNIRSYTGAFDDLLPVIKGENSSPGLVFIDGNHSKEPLLSYFYKVVDMSDQNTVVVIDDIYSSQTMAEAWGEIKKHRAVTLTVDIYRMGIVFFRETGDHFHYVIRH